MRFLRNHPAIATGLAVLLLASSGVAHLGAAPVEIGSRRELFVDRELVESLRGVELRLHTPEKAPRPRSPIQGAYLTVIKDGDLYRAYYRSHDPHYTGPRGDGNPGEVTCYAESEDGHEWRFPDLGLYDIAGLPHNNVVLARQPPFSHSFSPLLDTRPGVDPGERYKALAGARADIFRRLGVAGEAGLYAFVSADGRRWRQKGDGPVIPYRASSPAGETRFDSQNVAFWSEAEQRYVCYFRTLQTPHGSLRTFARTTSRDFVHWSEPEAVAPNFPGEHLYTSQAHPYFRAPHLYVALPTRFQPDRGNSTDILFMTSRAGSGVFQREFPEAYIRPGLDPVRWGNRSNYAALNVVPTGPAEMSIYHAGSGDRYVLRTDGFASARAGAREGELVTKPLVFAGRELVVNYSTSAAGRLRVELQDEAGRPLPGFRLEESADIIGDEIERTVRWQTNADLAAVAGRAVRIRLVLQECDVYSFRFR